MPVYCLMPRPRRAEFMLICAASASKDARRCAATRRQLRDFTARAMQRRRVAAAASRDAADAHAARARCAAVIRSPRDVYARASRDAAASAQQARNIFRRVRASRRAPLTLLRVDILLRAVISAAAQSAARCRVFVFTTRCAGET